jgi:Phosphatidylethanolamine-binding protein
MPRLSYTTTRETPVRTRPACECNGRLRTFEGTRHTRKTSRCRRPRIARQRADLERCTFTLVNLRTGTGAIQVGSLAFADHAPISSKYTADGPGLSPPLAWTGVPEGATSVVLIVEDADAPTPSPLVHAIVIDLSPGELVLTEGAIRSPDHRAPRWSRVETRTCRAPGSRPIRRRATACIATLSRYSRLGPGRRSRGPPDAKLCMKHCRRTRSRVVA